MKRLIALLLVCSICLGCAGCGGPAESGAAQVKQEAAVKIPENVQMYAPGTTLETDFGSITVMDAAFCEKAQIYYITNSRTTKTTVNGQTTETYEEFVQPGYISAMDGKLIFALKTVLTNRSGKNLELRNMEAKAFFADENPVYFTTGGNYEISSEAYSVLPDGESGEYIFAALLPAQQYQQAKECLFEIGGAELGFGYDSIKVCNALGFQPQDNVPVEIAEILKVLPDSAAAPDEPAAETGETRYYREENSLPTVDSVTELELSHSATDSKNGTITGIRYYYMAPKGQRNGPEMIDRYLEYLRSNGFTVTEDGINAEISLNGKSLASLCIMGTTLEVGMKIGGQDQKDREVLPVKLISPGETVALDFVEMKIDGIHRGEEIREDDGPDTYHRRASNSNNQMFWLETTMKNTGTSTFNIWGINKYFAEIVFDGTYTYEASIDKMVGMGNTELMPFESAKVYIWAEIPREMLDKYKNVVIRFGFNDYFEKADDDTFDSVKNRFEFNG